MKSQLRLEYIGDYMSVPVYSYGKLAAPAISFYQLISGHLVHKEDAFTFMQKVDHAIWKIESQKEVVGTLIITSNSVLALPTPNRLFFGE